MAPQKKGSAGGEDFSSALLEDEVQGTANLLIDDSPDSLLVLANRLQKALDARNSSAGLKNQSRVKKH
ncbi:MULTISPECIES: hypothetical protein [Ensifer]|uniref:hypothetical protein n=1 Tax=Ensifer TaxID=106591 RepID=UPI00070EE14F|nr:MULTISPECIES: hypothetical protein [Ensifer]KQU96043.1 hypothetical protein ASD00_20090 [Ensifer sp. Root31]KQW34921.1 hypothetical protein ASD02_17025 [Ensifer sp. Root1252]KRC57245.1 hypothetical protein ASE32_20340 [Ensifer sp. Root231]KRC87740.1 hypothetical protein ASE47_14495 [Ensifer sp. Root258]NOV21803.1 hypothetical protein [Ensifer canadensis]